MSALSLKLFGYPEVRIGKEEVTGFHSNKSRALLFYLAVTRRPQSRAVLAGMLWADFPEDRAMNNLRKTLSNLRKLAGEFLDIERERVAFDQSSDYWLDVADFEAGLQEFEAGKGSEGLERSIALYVGEFLEGFYLDGAEEWENWLLSERRRLRQAYHSALQALAEHHAEQGDFEPAIHFAQKLLNQDSLREDVQRMLMTLYAKNGQHVRALNQYETCRRILKAELSVEPAAETAALHESIRSGAVGPPEKIAPGATLFPGSGMDYVQPGFLDDETVPVEERRPPFIGRELELAQLDEHLAAALTGEGRIAFVTGEAGRGKSALLAEFTRRAQLRYPDLIAAAGNCNAFSGVGDPFHPFREILDQLCGDVEGRWRSGTITREQATRLWGMIPDTAQALVSEGASLVNLIHSGPALLARAGVFATAEPAWFLRLHQLVGDDGPSRVQPDQLLYQFNAVLGVLAQRHPLLLILDDMQWADNSSLDLLFQLSRNLVGKPILILGAYRPSDAALDPASNDPARLTPYRLSVDELKRRSGQAEIDLGRLSTSAEREFSDALIDREPNRLGEPFRVAFYQRTKGHPLFSIEMLQEMQDRGDLIRDEQGNWIVARQLEWERLPVRVEAVISQRINRLEEELRELLSAASVEGESFTVRLIARLLARDERWVLHQLARLQKEHRLVREISEVEVNGQRLTRYKFKHILFQQYLYEELSQGERRLLHGSIASGLQELYAGQEDDVMLSLAHHYTQAGQPGEAIPYLLAAGDRARTQNAFGEALNHYQPRPGFS